MRLLNMDIGADSAGATRAIPGDLTAFCEHEHPRLVGALSLYCGDAWLAEELAQEALLRVCGSWHKVSVLVAPGAWAHRVALNLANSHFRRIRAERRARSRYASVPREALRIPEPTDEGLKNAVAALPSRQRATVVFRFFLDMSLRETAMALGASEGAVKQLTQRALATLRATLPASVMSEEEPYYEQ